MLNDENLMFCCQDDCNGVLKLVDEKMGKVVKKRKLVCAECQKATCKLCKKEYHGEKKPCPIDDAKNDELLLKYLD